MKYCQNCGKELDDSAKFCVHCGHSQSAPVHAVQPQTSTIGGKHLHCPECRSTQLSPIVETDVQGGYAVNRSVGRKWGVSAFDLKSTHRNYWICGQCGHKFRNIQNLKEELAVLQRSLRAFYFLAALLAVIALVPVLFGDSLPVFLIITYIALAAFLFGILKKKKVALTRELEYLNTHCFD